MTHVELVGLTHQYARTRALSALSLQIDSGSLTALLGPSGCGKTTALRIVAGLLRPTVGDVRFDGRSMLSTPAERRGAVMVFQHPLLFPHLDVFENVAFGLRAQRQSEAAIRSSVSGMLERVKLGGFERRRPRELSGGQAQRVALARALVTGPRVLLLDEPLSSLDPHLRDEMRALIRDLHIELGLTTLLVTHDQQDAALLADRIAVLFAGRLAQHGSLRDLFDRPADRDVARFFGGVNFIPGDWSGDGLDTALGRLAVANVSRDHGPALATIRPEAVRFKGGHPHVPDRCNEVLGTVRSIVDLGTVRRVTLAAGPLTLEAHQSTDEPAPQVGESGIFYLPPDRIALLPAEPQA